MTAADKDCLVVICQPGPTRESPLHYLLPLKEFQEIGILSPPEFLELWQHGE